MHELRYSQTASSFFFLIDWHCFTFGNYSGILVHSFGIWTKHTDLSILSLTTHFLQYMIVVGTK
jgi:hypothetical protein